VFPALLVLRELSRRILCGVVLSIGGGKNVVFASLP